MGIEGGAQTLGLAVIAVPLLLVAGWLHWAARRDEKRRERAEQTAIERARQK